MLIELYDASREHNNWVKVGCEDLYRLQTGQPIYKILRPTQVRFNNLIILGIHKLDNGACILLAFD